MPAKLKRETCENILRGTPCLSLTESFADSIIAKWASADGSCLLFLLLLFLKRF